ERACPERSASADDWHEGARSELDVLVPLALGGELVGIRLRAPHGQRKPESREGDELLGCAGDANEEPRIGRADERLIAVMDVVWHFLRPPVELGIRRLNVDDSERGSRLEREPRRGPDGTLESRLTHDELYVVVVRDRGIRRATLQTEIGALCQM